jgi:hypothetical protein
MNPRVRRVLATSLAAALATCGRTALADSGRPGALGLEIHDCADVRSAEVERVLALELLADRRDDEPRVAETGPRTKASVTCSTSEARLVVHDEVSERTVTRVVLLSTMPAAVRDRLLAIALAELVWASVTEPPSRRATKTEAPPKPAGERARETVRAQRSTRPYEAGAVFASHGFPSDSGFATFGAGLVLVVPFRERLAAGVDLLAEYGTRSLPLGEMSGLVVSTRPSVGVLLLHGSVDVLGSVGARLGVVRLSGSATDARTASGATVFGALVAPTAAVDFRFRVHPRIHPTFDLEAGWVVRSVVGTVGGTAERSGATGAILGATLGLAIVL